MDQSYKKFLFGVFLTLSLESPNGIPEFGLAVGFKAG
jgi:hypothetical protein